MADADFDGFGGGFSTTRSGRPSGASFQRYLNIAGAVSSLALVIGLGFWGYKLAVRDVTGVPVVQALDGPMRVSPDNPGGEVADHQGLAVNEVAEAGTAAPTADRLTLAPRPVELTEEDAAGLAGQPVPDVAPASAPIADPDLALAAEPVAESADPTEVAVEAAVAEALGVEPVAEAPALEALVPEGAITRSLRPKARPGTVAAAPEVAVAMAAPIEVDDSTLAPGTRLVQFGAFDTMEEARAEWTRLQGRFTDLMAGKAMVVQAAESSGHTFFRLRAHGFEDEDEARRFCSAFTAENAPCIPVAQR
jgi:hypothetical protein